MIDDPTDPRTELGLRRIINASGTMTTLGASIMIPEAIAAMAAIAPHFVEMAELHEKASEAIAKATGAEAGTVTASTAAGISACVAACMTGTSQGRIEQLPDTTGMRNEVVIQLGHMVHYGHPIDQDIRVPGGVIRTVGQATETRVYQLEHALGTSTAAAVYVVSHHTARFGMIALADFCSTCRASNIPVIVDAASEYDLRGFLDAGADLVIYSGHKFLGGPTSGFVAGRKELIRAVYLQNGGIGRSMKVGKESICGLMAALQAWSLRDHESIRIKEQQILSLWLNGMKNIPGIKAEIVPDPTKNPLDRLRIDVDEKRVGITARQLADRLSEGDTPVFVRDEYAESGAFELDPCNLKKGHPELVLSRVMDELKLAQL